MFDEPIFAFKNCRAGGDSFLACVGFAGPAFHVRISSFIWFYAGCEWNVFYCVETKLRNSWTFCLVLKNASTLSPLENSTRISYFRNSPEPS